MMDFVFDLLPPWLHILAVLVSGGGLGLLGAMFPAAKGALKIVALAAAVGFVYYSGYSNANEKGNAKLLARTVQDQKVIDDVVAKYDKAAGLANLAASLKTKALQEDLDRATDKLKEGIKNADAKAKKLLDQAKQTVTEVVPTTPGGHTTTLTTGGLSIRGHATCDRPGISDTTGLQAPSYPETEPRNGFKDECRLDGQTAKDLISIVTDGDKAIVHLNAVIDAYNRVQVAGCTVESAGLETGKPIEVK